MHDHDRIVIDPKIQHGKPVIRGTRVPVARIVGGLAGGMTFDQVRDAFAVSDDDIRAALRFAAGLIGQDEHYAQPGFGHGNLTDMRLEDRITIEPGKRGGKPCIRGFRITVYDVLEYMAADMSEADILHDFPELTHEDILACLLFAANRERQLITLPD